jgi:hypothetical protein
LFRRFDSALSAVLAAAGLPGVSAPAGAQAIMAAQASAPSFRICFMACRWVGMEEGGDKDTPCAARGPVFTGVLVALSGIAP